MAASLLLTAIAAVLVVMPSSVTSVTQKCSVVSYAMDMRTCFNTRHLVDYVRIHNRASIVETSFQVEGLLKDPSLVCKENTTFSDLLDCLGGTIAKCMGKEEDKQYLPSTSLSKQGLDYFCQHTHDIDHDCFNNTYRKVFECINKYSAENIKSNDSTAVKVCTTVDITHDCIQAHITCSQKTQDLLLKFHSVYRKPPGCATPSRSDRKKYISMTGGSSSTVSYFFCVILTFVLVFMMQAE